MKMVILGAPGAGKGTQASALADYFSVPAISTGAIVRDVVSKGTELALKAEQYILKGQLVPDDVMIDIVVDRMSKPDCANGFVLDGFPRTVVQASALDEHKVLLDVVLSIEVKDDDILARISGRRVCKNCGITYHQQYRPSKINDVCDVCGGTLAVRDDDKKETVIDRLKVFHLLTEPVKEHYAKQGILKVVYGQKEISDTTREVFKVLGLETK